MEGAVLYRGRDTVAVFCARDKNAARVQTRRLANVDAVKRTKLLSMTCVVLMLAYQ